MNKLRIILFIFAMVLAFVTFIIAGLPSFNQRIEEINRKADLAITRSQESLGR